MLIVDEPAGQANAAKLAISFGSVTGAPITSQTSQDKTEKSTLSFQLPSKVEPASMPPLPFSLAFPPFALASNSIPQADTTASSSSQGDVTTDSHSVVNAASGALNRKNSDSSSHPRTPSPSLSQSDTKSAAFSFGKPPPSPSAQRKSHVEIPFGIAFSPKGMASPTPSSTEAASSASVTEKPTALPFSRPQTDSAPISTPSSGFSFGSLPNAPTGSSGFAFGSLPSAQMGSSGFAFGSLPSASSTSLPTTAANAASSQNPNPLPFTSATPTSTAQFGTTTTSQQSASFAFGASMENKSSSSSVLPFTFGSQPVATAPSANLSQPATQALPTSSASGFAFGQQPAPALGFAVPKAEPFGQSTLATPSFQFGSAPTQPTNPAFNQPTAAFGFGQNTTQPAANFSFGNNSSTFPAAPTAGPFSAASSSYPTSAFGSTPAFGAGSSTAARKGKTSSRRK
jgi:hypothetical protein